jgi:hypothetical protein
MDEKQVATTNRVLKKLSAMRATLSDNELKALDLIVTGFTSDVAAHKMAVRNVEQVADKAADKAADVAAHKMSVRGAEQVADKAADKAADVAAHKMSVRNVEQVADQAAEKAADVAAHKMSVRTVEQAADQTADVAAHKMADRSADGIITISQERAALNIIFDAESEVYKLVD